MFFFSLRGSILFIFFFKEFTDYSFAGQFDPSVFISKGDVTIPLIATVLKWRKSTTTTPFLPAADWHGLLRMHA